MTSTNSNSSFVLQYFALFSLLTSENTELTTSWTFLRPPPVYLVTRAPGVTLLSLAICHLAHTRVSRNTRNWPKYFPAPSLDTLVFAIQPIEYWRHSVSMFEVLIPDRCPQKEGKCCTWCTPWGIIIDKHFLFVSLRSLLFYLLQLQSVRRGGHKYGCTVGR